MRVSINEEWRFPNGTYIFTSDGRQVNPKDPEGAVIVSILARQAQDRKDNEEQRDKLLKTTYPRDAKKQEEARKSMKKDSK